MTRKRATGFATRDLRVRRAVARSRTDPQPRYTATDEERGGPDDADSGGDFLRAELASVRAVEVARASRPAISVASPDDLAGLFALIKARPFWARGL